MSTKLEKIDESPLATPSTGQQNANKVVSTKKVRSSRQSNNSNKDVVVVGRPDHEISPWWKSVTLISYFSIACGGIAGSISVGDLLAAFQNRCILYGKLSLVNLDKVKDNLTLKDTNVQVINWGQLYDCNFCEYASVSSTVFAGMLFAMFLQCGRGGVTKGFSRPYEIVLPALIVNLVFFIVSTVAFAKTIGGLSFFCDFILRDKNSPAFIVSCEQVLRYRYPWDPYDTDLYWDFIFAQFGTTLVFAGWLVVLLILLLRILLGVDFEMYRKKPKNLQTLYEEIPGKNYSDYEISNGDTDSDEDVEYSVTTDSEETTTPLLLTSRNAKKEGVAVVMTTSEWKKVV